MNGSHDTYLVLIDYCNKISPEGTTYWTMPNRITFKFEQGADSFGGPRVTVTTTKSKTGELVTLYDTAKGFLVEDPVLVGWVDEGIELLKKQYLKSKEDQVKEHKLLQQSLLQEYEHRFVSPDTTNSME